MTNVEKRILLNQREIMYALIQMKMNINNNKLSNGLGRACEYTNKVIESEEEND